MSKIVEDKSFKYFYTKGNKLKCKQILHVACPKWKNGNDDEYKKLDDCIKLIMDQVKIKNVKSIAMPFLSNAFL